MEFFLNFDKPHISEKVINFLEININEEEAKANMARLTKGLKLQYKEANAFIETLLKALTIEDGKSDSPFVPKKPTEDGKDVINDESFTGTLPKATKTQDDKSTPPPKKESDERKKTTCKFYRNGKCLRGKECKFDHPNICQKFRQFGLKALNEKGCADGCKAYHPNACRDSLKNKTCWRKDCRFYHLKGTKMGEGRQRGENSYNPPNSYQNSQNNNYQQKRPNFETKNRFEAFREKENYNNSKSVFQKDSQEETITLKDLMKEIMAIKARQDLQEKHQSTGSDTQDWREPRSTQEQERAWDSQRRNQSQNSQR